MSNIERELGWDDKIENDGPEFTLLPAGDYDFKVVNFERGRHNGSENLPACNKAIIHINIEDPDTGNSTTIKHNLFLHTKTEGMICAFFTAIGQRKRGEQLKPNWNAIVGSTGKAKVTIKKWTYDGKDYEGNEIKKFYEPTESPNKGFEAGRF